MSLLHDFKRGLVKENPVFKLLLADGQLRAVTSRSGFHLAGHFQQPGLLPIGRPVIAAVSLVVGEIQIVGIRL